MRNLPLFVWFGLTCLGLWACGQPVAQAPSPATDAAPVARLLPGVVNSTDLVPNEQALRQTPATPPRVLPGALPSPQTWAPPRTLKNYEAQRRVEALPKMRMRGITMTCPRAGAIWATQSMRDTLVEIKKLGSNWFTWHPYAWIRNDGALRFSSNTNDQTVLQPLQWAKELGLKSMLKPHIGYWGSKFSWRGDIAFQSEEGWRRFFRDYTAWIVTQAKMAEKGKADVFSIGLEYIKTLQREKEWRAVIAAVRKVYKGKLVYSSNWDAYTKVKFWDALDYIGIQAYFPVAKNADPSVQELEQGWKKVIATLSAYATKHKKKIIFTELGYNRSTYAGVRPWDYQQGGVNAEAVKLRCMKAALRALQTQPFLEGVFLWKWYPDTRVTSRDFVLQYPEMKDVIRQAWQ